MADNKLSKQELIDNTMKRFMRSVSDKAIANEAIEKLVEETYETGDTAFSAQTALGLRLAKQALPAKDRQWLDTLRARIGMTALIIIINLNNSYKSLLEQHGAIRLADLLNEYLQKNYKQLEQKGILEAAIRVSVKFPDSDDVKQVSDFIEKFQKEQASMTTPTPPTTTGGGSGGSSSPWASFFYFDTRTLPPEFADTTFQQKYLQAVSDGVTEFQGTPDELIVAAVTGLMLLDERFDPESPNFRHWVIESLVAVYSKEDSRHTTPRKDYFVAVAETAKNVLKRTGLSYSEFAYASQEMVEKEPPVQTTDPQFATMVNAALTNFVSGKSDFGRLELPPLLVEEAIDSEIESDNIRAVGMLYAGYHLEQMRLFDVVDRIMEIFMNGQLPIGVGAAGAALDDYYWTSEDRMSQAARYSHYSRVLGVAGGDVSREVQPNTEFNNLWLRFLSSVAEYDRQQRVADLLNTNNGQRSLATTIEHVRKAGRDLAANVSLYGWAATHYAAKRLSHQIELSFNILRQPAIQRAYAATGPFQVIERVAAAEFRQVPNIVRHRTMADAGNGILNIIAAYPTAWSSGSTRQELFQLPAVAGVGVSATRPASPGIIPFDKVQELLRQTQYWLAVMGVQDSQIDQLSQPVETPTSPTIPTGGFGGGADIDRLRQMVSQGQIPSMDELKSVFAMNGNAQH